VRAYRCVLRHIVRHPRYSAMTRKDTDTVIVMCTLRLLSGRSPQGHTLIPNYSPSLREVGCLHTLLNKLSHTVVRRPIWNRNRQRLFG
jgi:hypothetical protein